MRRPLALAALACVALAAGASTAGAWTPISPEMPVWNTTVPVPFKLNAAGSADLPFETAEEEVFRAMTDWALADCTGLSVRYEGTTTEEPNGNNTIAWMESGWPAGPMTLGITSPRISFFPTSAIISADMWLNGQDHTWVVGPPGLGQLDTYSIVLHEGGHYYGLGHSLAPGATMSAVYNNATFVLSPDDIEGICALYPGDGTPRDCSATGCKPGESCVGGVCSGGAMPGCSVDADCGAGQVCNAGTCEDAPPPPPPPTMDGCASDADCPMGQSCTAGACTVAVTPPMLPGACQLDTDCAAGQVCSGGTCTAMPVTPSMPPTTAPEPTTMAPGQGSLGMGSECTFDQECQPGLLCQPKGVATVCTAPCTHNLDCIAGMVCNLGVAMPTCVQAGVAVAPQPLPQPRSVTGGDGGCSVGSSTPAPCAPACLLAAGLLLVCRRRRRRGR